MKKDFITKTDVKNRRQWTDSLIKKYIPQPDLIKMNPYFRGASEMKLYELRKIEEIEKLNEFQIDFQKSLKRKLVSKKTVQTKKEKLLTVIDSLEIKVECKERNQLIKESVDSYNNRRRDNDFNEINEIDQDTLERLMVNYIRHRLTSYEKHLDTIFSKVGKNEAYLLLNKKIYNSISEIYPYLKEECIVQMEYKSFSYQ